MVSYYMICINTTVYFVQQVVVQSIEKAEDDAALKVLIELAESTPKFLRPQLENIFQVCIKVSRVISMNIIMSSTFSVQLN